MFDVLDHEGFRFHSIPEYVIFRFPTTISQFILQNLHQGNVNVVKFAVLSGNLFLQFYVTTLRRYLLFLKLRMSGSLKNQ